MYVIVAITKSYTIAPILTLYRYIKKYAIRTITAIAAAERVALVLPGGHCET
jgi:hypothetical protein